MTEEPIWLRRPAIEAMHTLLIRRDGGSFGLRDEGMLESALARPVNRWSYDHDCDLPTLAAGYGYGFAKNHGFVDGNKRIAFAAMIVFLYRNGWVLDVPEPEAVIVMLELAAGERTEEALAAWIRERIVPRTP